jgi:hypothetical protein
MCAVHVCAYLIVVLHDPAQPFNICLLDTLLASACCYVFQLHKSNTTETHHEHAAVSTVGQYSSLNDRLARQLNNRFEP